MAVVILSWNGRRYLEQFLPSVCHSTYPALRIYLADNASTDDTVWYVQQHFPEVTVIRNASNQGFAQGYNLALRQVESDYYILLNQDVAVTHGWIEPVVALMEQEQGIAACQPKLKSFHQKDYFEYAGAAGGYIDCWGYTFCRGRIFDTVEADRGQYEDPCPVFWASGAALFVKSAAFWEVGGLDPFFFAHMEEIDLCWRLQLAGYKVFYCPGSTVYHLGGGSLPQGNPRKTYLNFRNNLILLAKNLPPSRRWGTLLVRMLLDGLAALSSLGRGHWQEVVAILKAHRDFYQWWWCCRAKTPWKYGHSRQQPLSGIYKGSIVWQYFLRKKKYFHEL